MAWDFATDPAFAAQLVWIEELVREEIFPLETLDLATPGLKQIIKPLQEEVKERGLFAAHLPPGLGGQGFGQVKLGLMNEILGMSPIAPLVFGNNAPDSGNAELLALGIEANGAEFQRERYLEPLLRGELASGFSMTEPDAGADPTRISATALRDGDEWVISGQKVWTSYAHIATWGILLARTSNEGAPQNGISYFVCPMNAPGITIRPLVDMTGDHAFNEVFFDEVRLSADSLLGEVNEGWRLAKVTLGNERVALSGEGVLWGRGPTASDLVALVRDRSMTLGDLQRDELMRCWSHGEILRLLKLRLNANALAGRATGSDASLRKALADDHGQEVMGLAQRLAGSSAMLAGRGPGAVAGEEGYSWYWGFLYAQALTIGGGTSIVQRNIIAERVLGLMKDPVS